MKKILLALLCATMTFGLAGCNNDGKTKKDETPKGETSSKKNSADKVIKTSDRIIKGIKSSKSITDTGIQLESELPEISGDIHTIVYKTGNDVYLKLKIKENGELLGFRVETKDIYSNDDFIALVASATSISEFKIDGNSYDLIGSVLKGQKHDTEINSEITASCSIKDGNASFYIVLNKYK